MIRNLTLLLCIITLSVGGVCAQGYSSDAVLLANDGSTITIRSSGTASKRKEATDMAIKSAFYAYLVSGIDGVNEGRPLLGKSLSAAARSYVDGLMNGRYSIFVKGYTVDDKASKVVNKAFQTIVSVEIYDASLKRDMANSKVTGSAPSNMSLGETKEQMRIPKIMVVPYCVKGENFRDVIQKNMDIRMAMAQVKEALKEAGAEVDNFEAALEGAGTFEATQGGLELNEILINNAQSDVMVYVDMKKDQNAEGVRVTLIVTAVEVANRAELAIKSEVSGRKNTSPDVVCKALAKYLAPDFVKTISTSMASKITEGTAVSTYFKIDPNSEFTMSSRVGSANQALSTAIVSWIKQYIGSESYTQQGRSSKLLVLSEIKVPNSKANNFVDELEAFLLSLGLDIDYDTRGRVTTLTIK